MTRLKDPREAIGRAPERLSVDERKLLMGKVIALEIYDPQRQPLRRIEAVGDNVAECVRHLRERGLEPAGFEFTRLPAPY